MKRLTPGEHAVEMQRVLRALMTYWDYGYANPKGGERLMEIIKDAREVVLANVAGGHKSARAFYKVDKKGARWALSLKVGGLCWRADRTFSTKAVAVATGRKWCRRFSDQRAPRRKPERSSVWKQG